MTDAALDELEEAEAKATPGPWVWKGPDEPADLWTADGKDAIVCVQTTNHDIRFIQLMRKYAKPMLDKICELQEQVDWLQDGRRQEEQRLALLQDE